MSRRERGIKLLDKILERDHDAIDELLQKDVDLDVDTKGDMAIHLVARMGMMDVLRKLLQKGDSANKSNKAYGNTPAYYAAREGNIEMIRYLKKKGAQLNKQNKEGDSPLHTAVVMQSMDTIEQLVAEGMAVNLQNQHGETPLHFAVAHSRLEAMEALVLCGADPTIMSKNKEKAEDLAKSESVRKQIKTYSELIAAMESGFVKAKGKLITPELAMKPTLINRVGVVIQQIDLPENQPVGFYCRREKRENSSEKLPMKAQEEGISDIFFIRITDSFGDVNVTVSLPLYSSPSEKEQLVLKYLNRDPVYMDNCCQQREQTWFCNVSFSLIPETVIICGFVTTPRIEHNEVSEEGKIIESDIDTSFSLDIPAGAFEEITKLNLQVFDTKETDPDLVDDQEEENPDPLLLSDIYQINLEGEQPRKKIKMQIPYTGSITDANEICIIRGDETKAMTSSTLEVLPVEPEIVGQTLIFEVEHFCVHVTTSRKQADLAKKEIVDRINSALDREKPAVFYVMARKIDGVEEENLAVIECTTARDVSRRIKRRRKDGFNSQRPDRSGLFMYPPNQEFEIEIVGNVALVDESTERRLAFDPRRYSHQQYRVKLRKPDKKPEGAVRIKRIIEEEGQKKETELVTVLPLIVDIPVEEKKNYRNMPLPSFCPNCSLFHASGGCFKADFEAQKDGNSKQERPSTETPKTKLHTPREGSDIQQQKRNRPMTEKPGTNVNTPRKGPDIQPLKRDRPMTEKPGKYASTPRKGPDIQPLKRDRPMTEKPGKYASTPRKVPDLQPLKRDRPMTEKPGKYASTARVSSKEQKSSARKPDAGK